MPINKVYEITAEDLVKVGEQYRDYLMNTKLDLVAVVETIFDFIDPYEYRGDVLAFIVDLCSVVSDVTVKVERTDDGNYLMQVSTYGDYWGLDITVGQDVFIISCGLDYTEI